MNISRSLSLPVVLAFILDAAPLLAAGPMTAKPLAGIKTAAIATPLSVPALLAPSALTALPRTLIFPAATAVAPGAAVRMGQISNAVSASLEAAGPIEGATPGGASELGDRLQSALSGGSSATPPAASDGSSQTPAQNEKLRALKQIVSMFTEHYAPIEWKASHRGVDFVAEHQKARATILAKPDMPQREFQTLLADFVAATQDYHASIIFYSTERASLPLMILSAQGKYYIAYVDREALPKEKFPYQPGDEVVEFNGSPTAEAAAALTKTPNTPETDARLAEMLLTKRSRARGMEVPQGEATLKIKTADGAIHDATLGWIYKPEVIPTDVPTRGVVLGPESEDPFQAAESDGLALPTDFETGPSATMRALLRKFVPSMAHPLTGAFAKLAASNPDNGFMIGGRKTYVPDLGKPVWALPERVAEKIPFVVKIFQNDQGQRIGYLRIPDYMGGGDTDMASQLFEKLVGILQEKTDGLVIDQVNNPGGNMMLMNDMLSMLTDQPLAIPKHRLMLDESDAAMASQILEQASDSGLLQEMEEVLQQMVAHFQADPRSMLQQLVDYANFILNELKAGRRLTNPTSAFGIKRIDPHPTTRYTKPIVVLVNELDFSAADFFPAIMQDNKRATLFGVRTAGAGGAVKSVELPNQFGIEALSYTWTIAARPDGDPIENLGVKPDVAYAITADDLRTGFAGYGKALADVLAKLLPPPPPGTAVTATALQSSMRAPRRTGRRGKPKKR